MAYCCAVIENAKGQAMEKRASWSTDPRCQRHGRYKVEGRYFCYQHVPEPWKTHWKIVERIRAFPDRDIV